MTAKMPQPLGTEDVMVEGRSAEALTA